MSSELIVSDWAAARIISYFKYHSNQLNAGLRSRKYSSSNADGFGYEIYQAAYDAALGSHNGDKLAAIGSMLSDDVDDHSAAGLYRIIAGASQAVGNVQLEVMLALVREFSSRGVARGVLAQELAPRGEGKGSR
jgi:hypothetical protein